MVLGVQDQGPHVLKALLAESQGSAEHHMTRDKEHTRRCVLGLGLCLRKHQNATMPPTGRYENQDEVQNRLGLATLSANSIRSGTGG